MITIRFSRRSKYSWWRIIFLVCSSTAYSVLKSVYGLPMSSSPNQQTGFWICCNHHSTKAMKKQICTFFKFPNNREFFALGIVLHIKTAPEHFCPSAVPTYKAYFLKLMMTTDGEETIEQNAFTLSLCTDWINVRRRWISKRELAKQQIDCGKAEKGLKTTPNSECTLNALAIDEPLEYTRLTLDGEMQTWIDAENSLGLW